jgi:hypothetical protein
VSVERAQKYGLATPSPQNCLSHRHAVRADEHPGADARSALWTRVCYLGANNRPGWPWADLDVASIPFVSCLVNLPVIFCVNQSLIASQ